MIVLIPAFEPDERLVELVHGLRNIGPDTAIVVVDDGSGAACRPLFERVAALGCDVLRHERNRGKGRALRTGFAFLQGRYPGRDVVCADADGQHTVDDIVRVADRLRATGASVVLGARSFAGEVPARSRWGNTVTRWLFRLSTGLPVLDTQTGLRAFPAAMLPWLLEIPGDRYEYELRVLLRAARAGLGIDTVDIETIYLDDNRASHFRPLLDSLRIYAPLLMFSLSSLLAFVLDTGLLLLLNALTGSLPLAVVGARVTSAAVNFGANRRVVFERGRDVPIGVAAARYVGLAGALLVVSYLLLVALQTLGLALLAAKILTDLLLFVVSYTGQRRYVFTRTRPPGGARVGAAAAE